MKLLSLVFSLGLIISSPLKIFAQAPNMFNYQAVIRGNSGNLVSNQEITLRVSIIKGDPFGTYVFVESHDVITNQFGLINLSIGNGTLINGNIESIDWVDGPFYLKIDVDLNGGSNFFELGTTQLLSVPYALYAKNAGNVFPGDYDELTNKPANIDEDKTDDVLISEDQVIDGNKSFSNTILALDGINGNNKTISMVGNPSDEGDAVNKAYVDALEKRIASLENLILSLGNTIWTTDSTGIVRDINNDTYPFKRIGNQIWMTENLRSTNYSNGEHIPTSVPSNLDISAESEPKYQWIYGGNNTDYLMPYGRLYTWYAATDSRNVCPSGWHVPSVEEILILEDIAGGSGLAGGKLKETGTTHWLSPNYGATDSYGFKAVPGGYRSHAGGNTIGGEQSLGMYGFIWTSSSIDSEYAHSRRLAYDEDSLGDHVTEKNDGISVRCLKD